MRVVLKRPAYDGLRYFNAGLAENWDDETPLPKDAREALPGETADTALKKPKKQQPKALSQIAQKSREELEKEISAKFEAEAKKQADEIAELKAKLAEIEPAKDEKKAKI